MPIIAFIAIGRNYRGERSRVLFAVGYVMLALAIMQITAITMIPIERAAVRIGWNGMGGAFIYVSYGAVAVAAACVISLALGFLIRGQIKKHDIPRTWVLTCLYRVYLRAEYLHMYAF